MQTITLKVKSNNNVPLLISLAERLGISVVAEHGKKAVAADNAGMKKIITNGR